MPTKHIIPCGGLTPSGAGTNGAGVLPLNLWSGRKDGNNIELLVEDLHEKLYQPVPPQFEDLLEIAAYVYCADQTTSRGGKTAVGFDGDWRREFAFKIPVRVPELWNRSEVKAMLAEMLGFLADDYFDFEFVPAGGKAPGMPLYFPKLLGDGPSGEIEEVVLFSGGLDSLAGAVVEAVELKRRVLLVTHKPTNKLNNVHRKLEGLLAEKAGKFKPTHLHVRVNKDSDLNRNYTQRTRAFLYAAIGATVARMQGKNTLKFYENGVVSMNLPVCAQVVGSRATRTTHPRTLVEFGRLLSAVAGSEFRVQNDFIWDTKADVIKRIVKHGCEDLIAASVSCAHVYQFSLEHPHCGTCSQCIDRRVGMVAAGAERRDPEAGYKSDVFTGRRPTEEDRMMVATYVNRAKQLAKVNDAAELIAMYPDVARMLRFVPGKPVAAAEKVLTLQKRHAAEVNGAIRRMVEVHAEEVAEGSLAPDCLLRLAYDSGGFPPEAPAPAKGECQERQAKRWEAEIEMPTTYRLGRGYKVWNLVFAGKREVMADERAVALVEYLLKHPPEAAMHATVLENRVDGNPVADAFAAVERGGNREESGSSLGGVVQEGTGKKLMGGQGVILKQKLAQVQADIDDPTLPESEREEARQERAELLSAKGQGGRMVAGAEKSVDRVRKAIRNLIVYLKTAEVTRGKPNAMLRAFGEHLETHLWLPSMGAKNRLGAASRPGCFTYERPAGVTWRD